VLSATHKVQNEGYQLSVDPDAFVELVQTEVVGALDQLIGGPKVEIADIVKEVYDGILARRSQEGDTVGMPTGLRDLDRILLGFHPTDLLILAARPAMGKTALALNLALNVAFKKHARGERKGEHFGVMIFSLEMGREQLVMRLLSQRSRVGLTKLRKGDIDNEEEVFLREAAGDLHDLSLYIDDTPALSAIDLRARAKRVHMKYGLDLIVIDYLQLMRGSGGGRQSRENEISEISRALKGLAKELNVTVLALSQLNRGVEGRADKRPLMSDLRESGAIEQDADVIMFIYRDHVYNPETASEADAELNISKHRAGAIGKVELHFAGHLTRFTNRDDRYNDQYTGVRPDFG
jgi:replicative DNA helicase